MESQAVLFTACYPCFWVCASCVAIKINKYPNNFSQDKFDRSGKQINTPLEISNSSDIKTLTLLWNWESWQASRDELYLAWRSYTWQNLCNQNLIIFNHSRPCLQAMYVTSESMQWIDHRCKSTICIGPLKLMVQLMYLTQIYCLFFQTTTSIPVVLSTQGQLKVNSSNF